MTLIGKSNLVSLCVLTMNVFLQVLRCLKEKLPSPVVQAFVLDFEKGKIHSYLTQMFLCYIS